jgi:hypothetical protein
MVDCENLSKNSGKEEDGDGKYLKPWQNHISPNFMQQFVLNVFNGWLYKIIPKIVVWKRKEVGIISNHANILCKPHQLQTTWFLFLNKSFD